MAARRLKFKPKPLVGLMGRNNYIGSQTADEVVLEVAKLQESTETSEDRTENVDIDKHQAISVSSSVTACTHIEEDTTATIVQASGDEVTVSNSDAEKKYKNISANQKVLPRFGKSRFKPVLTKTLRKKDADSNKTEDLVNEATHVTKRTAEECNTSSDTGNTLVNASDRILEKENIDNNIIEEPAPLPPKEIVAETSSEKQHLENEVRTNTVDNNVANSTTDTGSEEMKKTPAKISQPKKHRSCNATQSTSEAMQKFKEKFKDGSLDKSKLIMRDLIIYNPTTNPMPHRLKMKRDNSRRESVTRSLTDELLEEQSVDDVEQNEVTDPMPVPQLKVGPDGKIMIDPQSLVIETTGSQKNRSNLENSEVVEENEFSYPKFYQKKKVYRTEWSREETLLFYKALNDVGPDFSLFLPLFPNKTRRDLKLKFKKEERCNLPLVNKALTSRSEFDYIALEKEMKKDREDRQKMLDEQKRKKEELKEKKKSELKKGRKPRKSAATKEFNEEDTGEIRNKGRATRKKRYEASDDKVEENNYPEFIDGVPKKKKKMVKDKRNVKVSKKGEVNVNLKNNLFDFDLNISSDEEDVCSSIGNDDDLEALNEQMFVRTRFGRQPKLKMKREKSEERPTQGKKVKTDSKVTSNNINNNNNDDENSYKISIIEGEQPTLHDQVIEHCYRLFEGPLDLSRATEDLENDDTDTDKTRLIDEDQAEEAIISEDVELPGSSTFTIRGHERVISESIQIIEQLTAKEAIDCGVPDLDHESNSANHKDLYILSNDAEFLIPAFSERENCDRSNITTVDEAITGQGIVNDSDKCTEPGQILNHVVHSLNRENNSNYIQILSRENMGIIISQSAFIAETVIKHTSDENCDNAMKNQDTEIHCYPSLDHTYTSLTPKPENPKKTLVILREMKTNHLCD